MRLCGFLTSGQIETIHRNALRILAEIGVRVEHELLPLAEKLYAWRLGIRASGSVIYTRLCGPLLEMFECHAAHRGEDLERVFGAQAFLVSPLDLPRPVCEQFLFFADRGLRLTLGNMPSIGGSAPVTLAGAASLSLAEQIFLHLAARSFWSDCPLILRRNIVAIDMRTGSSCTSPPASRRQNLALADVARFYGCGYHSQAGGTDAKLPSYEAGVQKAMGALLSALASGHGSVSAGQLSNGDVCSGVQMVLDADLAEALRSLCRGAVVDETECAFEEIGGAGIGGNHFGTDFTAARFRKELDAPGTWSLCSVGAWEANGRAVDLDRAREIVRAHDRDFEPVSCISAEEEKDLRAIVNRAGRRLDACQPRATITTSA